jgi:hypothetical protein
LAPSLNTRPRPLPELILSALDHPFSLPTSPRMDLNRTGTTIKKQEDDEKAERRADIKPPVKTLNRVPRKLWISCFCLEILRTDTSYNRCLRESSMVSYANDSQLVHQNACRKQKMRCEGADNPPCKRCRNTNLECLFEKPSREATLTGEAGLE